jgi:uncharacterized RDD family membrane protein YckC
VSIPSQAFNHAWAGDPPEPFAAPEYYRGVLSRRVFAYCLDALAIAATMGLAWFLLWGLIIASLGLLFPLWPLWGLIPVAYHTLLIGGRHSATLGMRAVGIEVRSWTGDRPDYLQALVLTVLFYISTAATCSLILLVALFERRRRTVHDMVAGTLVIRRFPEPEVLPAS